MSVRPVGRTQNLRTIIRHESDHQGDGLPLSDCFFGGGSFAIIPDRPTLDDREHARVGDSVVRLRLLIFTDFKPFRKGARFNVRYSLALSLPGAAQKRHPSSRTSWSRVITGT